MQIFSKKTVVLKHFEKHHNITLIISSIIIGIGGGYGAVAFRYLINLFQSLFYGDCTFTWNFLSDTQVFDMLLQASPLRFMLIPILGGLIIGPLIYFCAREAKGHGVPEVMEAVNFKGGVIRKRLVFIKALASAICIASGGSIGREGPIVQIGSSWGSTFGQLLRLTKEDIRILVGCGAAAGIAATFNAPIAGAFFALEIILGNFKIKTITPIMVSSVISTVIAHIYLENAPSFLIPAYSLVSIYEIPLYIILGLISAFVGLAFITMLYGMEDFFDKIRFPEYLKPGLGGLFIGIIGWFCIEVYGVGYGSINLALQGELVIKDLCLLLVFKCVATSITLGTGGSGGIFAPSLFMGAMVGGIVGHIFHYLLPEITASSGAYALVGMGCVVAATTHAPISAIVILFEMTRDYRIILPLMLSCVISVTLIRHLKRESIYTMKLVRRGTLVNNNSFSEILNSLKVKQVMHTKYEIVTEDMTLKEVIQLVFQYGHFTFPVMSADSRFCGIISLHDFQGHGPAKIPEYTVAKDMIDHDCIFMTPEHTLLDALNILGSSNVDQIPVVEVEDHQQLVGMLSREDLLSYYYQSIY